MVYHNSMLEKINIYILLLRAYVVRGFDVVVNIARFCRRVFVVRAFVTARFCLRAFVCAHLSCALLLRRPKRVSTVWHAVSAHLLFCFLIC